MKFSIITPCFNRATFVIKAVKSVLLQNYPNFEHIIVDGGSTDDTLTVLAKYPHLKIISGPDQGMYDAINKGLAIADGEIIGFLNTDDLYAENAFLKATVEFEDERVMAVAGEALVFMETPENKREIIGKYSPENASLLECSTIGSNYFNAWFFRKSVFEEIGVFNIEYKVAADRDLMLRFALNDLKYAPIKLLTYEYCQHAGSLTFDDTFEKREVSAIDHLLMTDFYLRDEKLEPEPRRLLLQLRVLETQDMAKRSLRAWNLKKLTYYASEGRKYDSAWTPKFLWAALPSLLLLPFRLVRQTLKKTVSFLKRKFRN